MPEGEAEYLTLYGTGIRHVQEPGYVQVTVGGLDVPVVSAGPKGDIDGLDQITCGPLPVTLKEKPGEIDVLVTVDGKKANTVKIGVF